ncbi:hypothetical protein M231_05637 [Tremella mesenterica]|uniref:Type 1 phosphatases regulator n=1 Tax=Tremella mesenterica TaxID=5217 RepID=A0A4Q1BHH4_TREME|nr:hypothetical protein M231_05637 [Tremella mesenterica]
MQAVRATPIPSSSRTITLPDPPAAPSTSTTVGVLKLRGAGRKGKVVWSEGTVDNEHLGRKKSKICCIYHKPRAYDESSSESSESDCDSHSHPHSHSRPTPNSGKKDGTGSGQGTKRRDAPVTQVEESSESEGGAGDGKARPMKGKNKPKNRPSNDPSPSSGDNKNGPKGSQPQANKYDYHPPSHSHSQNPH